MYVFKLNKGFVYLSALLLPTCINMLKQYNIIVYYFRSDAIAERLLLNNNTDKVLLHLIKIVTTHSDFASPSTAIVIIPTNNNCLVIACGSDNGWIFSVVWNNLIII